MLSTNYELLPNIYNPIFKTASNFWKWGMRTSCSPARRNLGCGTLILCLFCKQKLLILAHVATYL